MKLIRLTCTALFLLFSRFVFAQNATISGKVEDTSNHSALSYVSIGLYKSADSSLVTGTLSKDDGSFSIAKQLPGTYYLKIQFMGYNTSITPQFSINKNENKQMGLIGVKPTSTFLKEIAVTGKRAGNLNKIDKQTYRADQFEAAKGGSAVDVLKNLPSVAVSGQGEISVRGATGFQVMINGKPVLSDAQTILSQLPANSLENVELITAPSAKYDADGKAGIINIITKKGANDGITFTANAQGGLPSTTDYNNLKQPQRFGGDATLNFRKNKWDISVGGNYTRNDTEGFREGDVFVKNRTENTITRLPSEGERSFNRYNYAGRANIGYNIDGNNTLSLGFFAGKKFQDRLAALDYHNTTSDLTTNALLKSNPYYNNNLETKEGNFTLGNLDYSHSFKDKSTLSTSFLYEKDNLYGNDRNLNLKSDAPNAALIQLVYNPYTKPLEGYRFKIDHAIALGKGKLESGYQFRYDTQEGNYGYEIDPVPATPDYDRFIGSAKSKNIINAFYSQYSGKASKLEYVGGLRYEYSKRTVDLVKNTSVQPSHQLNLSNLFPSANILYSFSDFWKLKAGYSKRIQRTSNNELNPIAEREHSESLEQGDPDVLPEFVNLTELGLIKNFNKGSVFATAYYQQVKNPIQRVNSIYADSILNRLFTNAGKARSLGLEIGTNYQVNKWWNFYVGGNVYNYRIKGDLTILGTTTPIYNQTWVYSVNANTNFQLAKAWSLQANVNYLSNRPTAQGEDSRFLSPNMSLKKSFLDGRFAATFQWQNIDLGMKESNRQRITTSGADFYTTTNYIYEPDVLIINLSFNLDKLKTKDKLPKTEFGDKEF
ncbi:TonB-dependent receptor [Pedobacter sp. SD-b]|uniref:TonB-dependent receptor n=1 Tax=Pedobacter segetis TaxID=2793069 RepID=A0ABS1BI30_9SPHI|nr:TonB-dependent receptor [Pedobacter segetis]MBK0382016.1 TonB-dependent receptor [Pedobacter segetis]